VAPSHEYFSIIVDCTTEEAVAVSNRMRIYENMKTYISLVVCVSNSCCEDINAAM
jgi:hypothetical protein